MSFIIKFNFKPEIHINKAPGNPEAIVYMVAGEGLEPTTFGL